MQKRWVFVGIALLIASVVVGTIFILAPNTTAINFLRPNTSGLDCLKADDDSCLVMPSVTGFTSDSIEIQFPEQFEADYHLVVMPFDREQQVLAVTWLPLFQELAEGDETIQYWSIAALPELNSAVRFLVLTGIRSGISDDVVLQQVVVLFLEQQALFLEALAIDNDETIQVFIMDSDGIVYYRASGEFTTEKGQVFQDALNHLQANR